MSLLSPCVTEINKYSFLVKDVTTQQTYDTAGVDLTTVTAAKIVFKNLFDSETYEIDVLSDWEYLLGDGITINIVDFPSGQMGDYTEFPDWMYEITVEYTYDSKFMGMGDELLYQDINIDISRKINKKLGS